MNSSLINSDLATSSKKSGSKNRTNPTLLSCSIKKFYDINRETLHVQFQELLIRPRWDSTDVRIAFLHGTEDDVFYERWHVQRFKFP